MADQHTDELAGLLGDDFDLPVTDAFIAGVHSGVRRRRLVRALTTGGVLAVTAGAVAAGAVTAGVVTSGVTPAGPDRPPAMPGPAGGSTAAAPAVPAHRSLDGFRVTFVPDGLRIDEHGDGHATYPVSPDRLHNDGSAPTGDRATAATTLRIYVLPNGASRLWITVLRPERTTAQAGRDRITAWLAGWSVRGAEVVERYALPAGQAQLARTVGTETTTHDVVITTPDGVVLSVGGNGTLPVADLKAVAAGLRPE